MADEVRVVYEGQERRAKLVVPMPVDSSGDPVDYSAAIGSPSDAPWNGTDPQASIISLLKAIALNTDTA
jgi:hypothetical protein